MDDWNDAQLLAAYAAQGSEAAFGRLVERHLALVHTAARRQARDVHLAEEITQATFILLAQKAATLKDCPALAGWLCRTAHFAARNAVRHERRRRRHEQEAHTNQNLLHPGGETAESPNDDIWQQLAPLLDEAVAKLNATDRNAVVLRFYEQKPLAEVGAALGLGTDAAQKRVTRAVEKLRKYFLRRGVTLPAVTLGAVLAANAVQAAPAGLAQTISAIAITKGAAASVSTLTLLKSTLKLMAWTKAKTVIIVSAAALLATGTTTVVVKEVQAHRKYPWQIGPELDYSFLEKLPPQVKILNSDFSSGASMGGSFGKVVGKGAQLQDIISQAYSKSLSRIIFDAKTPTNYYDFLSTFHNGNETALQREIKRKFGLVGKLETRDTDVLLLKAKTPNAPGLKPGNNPKGNITARSGWGKFQCENYPLSGLLQALERWSKIPIIDNTGLTNHYNIDLIISPLPPLNVPISPDDLNSVLADQLGLELVPTNMPLEILVVDKAK